MKQFWFVLKSALAGAALTLASGLIPNTPGALVGASWYGWPVTWIRKLVIAPQYNPWIVDWQGLVIDFIFWSVLILVIIYIICYFIGKTPAAPTKKSRSKK